MARHLQLAADIARFVHDTHGGLLYRDPSKHLDLKAAGSGVWLRQEVSAQPGGCPGDQGAGQGEGFPLNRLTWKSRPLWSQRNSRRTDCKSGEKRIGAVCGQGRIGIDIDLVQSDLITPECRDITQRCFRVALCQ